MPKAVWTPPEHVTCPWCSKPVPYDDQLENWYQHTKSKHDGQVVSWLT